MYDPGDPRWCLGTPIIYLQTLSVKACNSTHRTAATACSRTIRPTTPVRELAKKFGPRFTSLCALAPLCTHRIRRHWPKSFLTSDCGKSSSKAIYLQQRYLSGRRGAFAVTSAKKGKNARKELGALTTHTATAHFGAVQMATSLFLLQRRGQISRLNKVHVSRLPVAFASKDTELMARIMGVGTVRHPQLNNAPQLLSEVVRPAESQATRVLRSLGGWDREVVSPRHR